MTQSATIDRPRVPAGSHPVVTKRYLLSTPPLVRLCKDIRLWLDMRVPGAMIEGQQRYGKTRAVLFAVKDLQQEHGEHFPVFSFNCRRYTVPSDATFYGDMLGDLQHSMARSGSGVARRERLINYLCAKAYPPADRRVVLIVDEAQRLREAHYHWLVDLYNELERQGVVPTVILVGQPELVHQRDAFDKARHKQIVGRFMVHHHHFEGVKKVSDLRTCLRNYDEATEYPEQSGCSFTRYFFPAAFDSGWRLAGQEQTLWDAFQEVRAEAQLPGKAELPMQYLVRTVENALRHFTDLNHEVNPLSLNQWKQAINWSGYRDAGRYLE